MLWSCHKKWSLFPIPGLEDEVQIPLCSKMCLNPFPTFDISLSSSFSSRFPEFTACSSPKCHAFLDLLSLCSWVLLFLHFWKIATHRTESRSYITISMSPSPTLLGRINSHSIFLMHFWYYTYNAMFKVVCILSTFTSLALSPPYHKFQSLLWSRKPKIQRQMNRTLEMDQSDQQSIIFSFISWAPSMAPTVQAMA